MRIIPARAGFTPTWVIEAWRRTDHPRSRGVYYSTTVPRLRRPGSSPLARGLPAMNPIITTAMGIIPARAGFTVGWLPARRLGRDHPRSRGVYTDQPVSVSSASGSSPLARGLLVRAVHGRTHRRIIPARAGFTGGGQERLRRLLDHPRSRGVYPRTDVRPYPITGSSPLARGLLIREEILSGIDRIIPARAGFTGGRTAR